MNKVGRTVDFRLTRHSELEPCHPMWSSSMRSLMFCFVSTTLQACYSSSLPLLGHVAPALIHLCHCLGSELLWPAFCRQLKSRECGTQEFAVLDLTILSLGSC